MSKRPTCTICDSNKSSGYKSVKFEDNTRGWVCESCLGFRLTYPEFVPDRVNDQRREYFNTLVQPFRQGEFSKEYAEAYPEQTKQMIKEGRIKQEDADNAKEVWKDLKGHKSRKKSK